MCERSSSLFARAGFRVASLKVAPAWSTLSTTWRSDSGDLAGTPIACDFAVLISEPPLLAHLALCLSLLYESKLLPWPFEFENLFFSLCPIEFDLCWPFIA